MTPTRPGTTVRVGLARTAAALVMSTGLAGLAACAEQDDAAKAVRESYADFGKLGGGAASAADAYANQVYNDLVRAISPTTSADSPHAVYAQVILAQAKTGVAQEPLRSARQAADQITRELRVVRSMFSDWQRWQARAQAADLVSTEQQIASLRSQGESIASQMTAARGSLQQSEQEIASLRTQSDELLRQSRALRDQAGQIQLEVSTRSAVEAADAAPRIRELSREADRLEQRALLIEARADMLEPVARDRRLEIERLTDIASLLDTQRTELRQREQNARAEAADARANAASLEEQIATTVAQVREQYQRDFIPAIDRATQTLAEAASAVSRARDAGEVGTVGLAGVRLQQAETAALLAETNAELADRLLPMRDAGVLPADSAFASNLASQSEESIQAARSAYTEAAEAFRRIRSRDHADSFSALADSLEQRAESVGLRRSNSTPETNADADAGNPASPPMQGFDSPEAAAQAVLDAADTGDWTAVMTHSAIPVDNEPLARVMLATINLETAAREAFGTGVMATLAQMGMGATDDSPISQALTGQLDLAGLSLDDLAIQRNDTDATVSFPDGSELPLVLSDAGWQFAMNVPDDMAMMLPPQMANAISAAITGVADRVRQGEFSSVQQVLPALQQAMLPAMQGMMGDQAP